MPIVEHATGAASTQSVEDTKHKTERLTKAKANSGLSTSAGENGKEIPQSKEDNHKANDRNIAMETSKPTESKVKPTKPEGNDSNAVSK